VQRGGGWDDDEAAVACSAGIFAENCLYWWLFWFGAEAGADLQGVSEVKKCGGLRGAAVTSSLTRQNTLAARSHVVGRNTWKAPHRSTMHLDT
jgi:hypothetical protein